MQLNLLTEEQFVATMSDRMVDATEFAEPVVDIWPYVEVLVAEGIVEQYVYDDALVEMVSRNKEDSIDHVLLPTDNEDVFVVIVVDFEEEEIYGHFTLDLTEGEGGELASGL